MLQSQIYELDFRYSHFQIVFRLLTAFCRGILPHGALQQPNVRNILKQSSAPGELASCVRVQVPGFPSHNCHMALTLLQYKDIVDWCGCSPMVYRQNAMSALTVRMVLVRFTVSSRAQQRLTHAEKAELGIRGKLAAKTWSTQVGCSPSDCNADECTGRWGVFRAQVRPQDLPHDHQSHRVVASQR